MSELLGNRLFTALDADGKPIAGAKLYFYLAGTTTPADVFQDATRLTPHATPVACDSAGRAADVYFDPAVNYKMVIEDASDVTIRTIDPVAQVNLAGVESTAWAVEFLEAADAGEALNTLDIVNIYNEVTINDTYSVGSSFPACYVITDKASPADYNIFLPSGAVVGSLVYFRVEATATKLFTLYDSGTDIEGDDRIILTAGESIMLLKKSSGWKRVGGVKIPITTILRATSSQSLTTGVAADVVFGAAMTNIHGGSFGLSLNTFRAPRKGVYRVTVNLSTTGSAAGEESRLRIHGGTPPSPSTQPAQALSCLYGFTGSPRLTHCLSAHFPVARSDTVVAVVTVTGTSPAIEYAAGSVECTMHVEEIIT